MASIRRVTVFGGSGFIGRYIVKRLAAEGAVVTVVGRHASDALFLRPMGDVGQIALINASFGDEAILRRAVAGADSVVNLIGILAEGGRQRFDAVHHEGAGLIGRLAREAGVDNLLHVSALGADPDSPSHYARSKAAGEAAIRAAFPAATIFRPSVVFGAEDRFFNRFAEMAQLSRFLPLIGGGHTKFQPVYVCDIADAALIALKSPQAHGRTYELGGPVVYSFRELMELLLAEIDSADNDTVLRRHALIDLPFPIASALGSLAQCLPNAPLTRDQVTLLKSDSVVHPGAPGFRDLGIEPTAPDIILPSYLGRFRKEGWYSSHRMAN